MGLLSFLSDRSSAKRMAMLSQQIAQNCQRAVWERVHVRAATMRLIEARGYVRARAAQDISDEIDRVLRNDATVDPSKRIELTTMATDIVISSVARDLLHLPAPYTMRRRAA